MAKAKSPIYELRVELADTKPAIWRTFRIPSKANLADLHMVLQTVMGWTNSHLHEFRAGTKRYAQPYPDGDDFGDPAEDEADVTVDEVLKKPKQKITYTYDFGDNWEHVVTLVAIHQDGPGLECLAGERACPPDDCGGSFGFDRLLDILANRKHPEHREMKRWLSDMRPNGYDPAVFERDEVNEMFVDGLAGLRGFYADMAEAWGDDDDFDDDDKEDGKNDDGKIIDFPKGRR